MEILKILNIMEMIKRLKGPWDVYYAQDTAEMDEETALRMTEGKVSIISGGTLKGVCKDGQSLHELRGSVSFGGFRYREIIKWNGKDVDSDDLNVSSHLSDSEDRRLIVDFKFKSGGSAHWFRFLKQLDV